MDSLSSSDALWHPYLGVLNLAGIALSEGCCPEQSPDSSNQARAVETTLTRTSLSTDSTMLCTGLGRFSVALNGSSIQYALAAPHQHFAPDEIESVLSTIVAIALHRRGCLCLHASSVELHGQAITFAGPPTAGKSSFASACIRSGANLIADDLSPVTVGSDGPELIPTSTSLKLVADMAGYWLEEDVLAATYSASFGKHTVQADRLQGQRTPGVTPLKGIFLLNRTDQSFGSSVYVERVTGHRIASILLRNSYLGDLIPKLGMTRLWLDQIAALSKRVPVNVLQYSNGPHALTEAQAAVFRWLEQQQSA